MKIIKLALSLILLVVLGLGGVYIAENRGLVQAGTFTNLTGRFAGVTQTLPTQIDSSSVGNTVSVLSSQVSPKTAEVGEVLGTSVAVEKQEPPLTQRAFEYARYNYCQAVVKDYEARQAAPATSIQN